MAVTIVIRGRDDRDRVNGAQVGGDSRMHLGHLIGRRTACGLPFDSFLATYDDVEITCPACTVAIMEATQT